GSIKPAFDGSCRRRTCRHSTRPPFIPACVFSKERISPKVAAQHGHLKSSARHLSTRQFFATSSPIQNCRAFIFAKIIFCRRSTNSLVSFAVALNCTSRTGRTFVRL